MITTEKKTLARKLNFKINLLCKRHALVEIWILDDCEITNSTEIHVVHIASIGAVVDPNDGAVFPSTGHGKISDKMPGSSVTEPHLHLLFCSISGSCLVFIVIIGVYYWFLTTALGNNWQNVLVITRFNSAQNGYSPCAVLSL